MKNDSVCLIVYCQLIFVFRNKLDRNIKDMRMHILY